MPFCGCAWVGSQRGRATRALFRVGYPPSVDQRSGATPSQSTPRRRGHGGLRRARKRLRGTVAGVSAKEVQGKRQCIGNASRERLRTVRCVPHRARTVCRTSAARVTHACMTLMHAEGSAATDRDILAQGSSPVRGTPWRRESLEARRDVERRRSSSPSYAVELRLRGASCNGALSPCICMRGDSSVLSEVPRGRRPLFSTRRERDGV